MLVGRNQRQREGRSKGSEEGEDKEKHYAKDRRSGVTVGFTDLLPPSLFM